MDELNEEVGYERFLKERKKWLSTNLQQTEPIKLDPEEIENVKRALIDEETPEFPHKVPLDQLVDTLEELWDEKDDQCSVCTIL